ncbi:MAG TPA: hypothetical protein VHU91_01185 [Mycobacteriales bacterium]|nr:hypothetical protein [Mycobacteriales bacterium]
MVAALVPVGHSVGPLYTPRGEQDPDSYEIRYADGIFSIDHEELRVWGLTHGDPATVNSDPPTRENVIRDATELDNTTATQVIDRLCDVGLLVEFDRHTEQARDFAYRHQIEPIAIGLGNTPDTPWYFQIGLPETPRVMVGHDAYHLWMFAHRHASLWDACEYVAADRRTEAILRSGPESDPDRILSHFLDALPAMIATSCAYVDRVR